LRTPLTAILGQVEVSLRRERPAEEYRRVLSTVQQKAAHLRRIIESLLFLARANNEAMLPDCELIDLASWLPERLESWSEHPRSADLVLKADGPGDSLVRANPALLSELFDVLFDNACKFSAPGTPIQIGLGAHDGAVLIEVQDRGCGIAPADLPRLFTPFYRSEEARGLGIEGTGLGLSIAQRLAGLFGGQIAATSDAGAGSCFTLKLPAAQAPNLEERQAFAVQDQA
jgi:signal transduction histidine kinase